ncbi:hypothetical protein [Vibrio atypicus]|uniref:hypothetical protein n=1 Tax=Vibrio atypicus TaxID=558271 RepID=UPI0013595F60|nr:hypothetical protein [Vibrio atypicus]
MKLKLLSTLIAASVLAGCSSGGSSSNDSARGTPVNPIEIEIENPIETGGQYTVDAQGTVYNNGTEVAKIDTTTGLLTVDGVVIGSVDSHDFASASFVMVDHSSGNTWQVVVDKNGNLTITPLDVDGGWGNVPKEHPIEINPENPIEHGPQNPIEAHPENPIETGGQYSIDAQGKVYNNGTEVASLDTSTGLITVDGVVIGRVDSHDLKSGTLVIVDHSSGNTYNVAIDKSGNLTISPADVDADWGLNKQPKLDELKTNLQSLSQEQRQQLKQAIKDRVNARS